MATITFKGNPIQTCGSLPAVGGQAPAFSLTGADLQDVGLAAFPGKKKILSIVPSLDTGICAMSAVRFNKEVGAHGETVILNISADLPFAAKRFCDAEKLEHITILSSFRHPEFGQTYGVTISEGPLAGLLSRAVLVLNADNTIVYAEQVPEIAQEPNYEAVLAALKNA
ncbi:MAG TPA: thiol peroxidase [Kiritimatiellia bacterium]|nr:thiol peroxidase [Kiritimatiellia bacterium]HMO97926.1 thiol peroxidase [Kiritimatiellia bacterium]HMP95277.1 thiol peroxidase [Kiritimatiellia bacterium]